MFVAQRATESRGYNISEDRMSKTDPEHSDSQTSTSTTTLINIFGTILGSNKHKSNNKYHIKISFLDQTVISIRKDWHNLPIIWIAFGIQKSYVVIKQ